MGRGAAAGNETILGLPEGVDVAWLARAGRAMRIAHVALWVGLMLAFEFTLGRAVFRMSWRKILADLDPTKGGFLAPGMLVLLGTPWIVAGWRGLF